MGRNYDRTLVTEERIENFLERLAQRKKRDVAGIRALCLGERNFLKNAKYVKRGDDPKDPEARTTLSVTRRHKLLTGYRNAIRERFGDDHPALRYMLLSDEEQDARNAVQRATIIDRHGDRRALDVEKYLEAALEVLAKALEPNPPPALLIAAALIAVTGRRPIEILLTGNLLEVPPIKAGSTTDALFDRSVHHAKRWAMIFGGQAKTRGAETARNMPYFIPVLAPPALILEVFEKLRLRYNVQGLTPQEVGNRAWKELGRYAKACFVDHAGEGIKPSELRAAYTTIAYERYAPEKFSWNRYTARILGHSEADIATSFSYDQFYPVGSKRAYDREIHRATRETLEALREQREREADPVKAGYLDEKIKAVEKRMEGEK